MHAETLTLSVEKISPLMYAAMDAMPSTKVVGNAIQVCGGCVELLEKILSGQDNGKKLLLQNKAKEYIQLIVLKVILNSIIGPCQLKLASWSNDLLHKMDAIVYWRNKQFNVDFTLSVNCFQEKLHDTSRENKSDWVTLFVAPDMGDFLSYILSGYQGDFSEASIIAHLEKNPTIVEELQWNIKNRQTRSYPIELGTKPCKVIRN